MDEPIVADQASPTFRSAILAADARLRTSVQEYLDEVDRAHALGDAVVAYRGAIDDLISAHDWMPNAGHPLRDESDRRVMLQRSVASAAAYVDVVRARIEANAMVLAAGGGGAAALDLRGPTISLGDRLWQTAGLFELARESLTVQLFNGQLVPHCVAVTTRVLWEHQQHPLPDSAGYDPPPDGWLSLRDRLWQDWVDLLSAHGFEVLTPAMEDGYDEQLHQVIGQGGSLNPDQISRVVSPGLRSREIVFDAARVETGFPEEDGEEAAPSDKPDVGQAAENPATGGDACNLRLGDSDAVSPASGPSAVERAPEESADQPAPVPDSGKTPRKKKGASTKRKAEGDEHER
jgi:hypothetical protein